MNEYFQLLQEKVLDNSELIETNFKFNLLAGPQRWVLVKGKVSKIISNLAMNAKIPFLGIQKGNDLYIFDLSDKYQDIIADTRIKSHERLLGTCKIPPTNDKFHYTYPVAGKMPFAFKYVLTSTEKRLVETHKNFGLDFAIWLTEFKSIGDEIYIEYILEPRKFIFKKHFLSHIIPSGYKGLTISFVAKYMKIANLLIKLGAKPYLNLMFSDKLLFADAFETYVFKRIIESATGIKYEPLIGVRDYKLRIENMLETLKAIKK